MSQTQTAVSSRPQTRKLFYRINEVARITGLKPYVLRYWESEFDELTPEKDRSDQRRYRDKDVLTIRAIQKLLHDDKYTIKGARAKLKGEVRLMRKGARAATSASPVASSGKKRTAASTLSAAPAPRTSRKKTKGTRGAATSNMTLGQTLHHLRNEVAELIEILGG